MCSLQAHNYAPRGTKEQDLVWVQVIKETKGDVLV